MMTNSNLSYWEKESFFNYDVLIIGSGILGLSAAITLKNKAPNLSVAILERGFLPSGASTKNAGFACFGSISELIEQEKNVGTDGLHSLIEKRWNGLLKLRNWLSDRAISYSNLGGYELFSPQDSTLRDQCVAKIDHFNLLLHDIFKNQNSFKIADAKISSFSFNNIQTLIENRFEAQIDTGKMMKALINKATAMGIYIYNNCDVHHILPEHKFQKVSSNQGQFKAKRILLTTNAFIKDYFPDLDLVPGRGQVLITQPIKNLKINGTFHYDRGYYYFRNIDNRLLIGGGRHLDFEMEQTSNFGTTPIVMESLKKLLHEVILPNSSYVIDYSWSGIMAFGKQITPIIKMLKPNVFCAVRCNGMGVAMGTQTGTEAAEFLLKSI
jgi:glycine/D-amino acid oxidase-like deaminating enzyme